MQNLNQTQLTLRNFHESKPHSEQIDVDQFEQLSTLLFHKILHLPLIDMKAKHLLKPERK